MRKRIQSIDTIEYLSILHDNYVWNKDISQEGKDDPATWHNKGYHTGILIGVCIGLGLDFDDEKIWEVRTKKIIFKRGAE